MAKTRLFIIRHGKTMFNTIGRAQGWSDTPLTTQGEEGIRELGVGLRESGLDFVRAVSSDSGRAIPYTFNKKIREWCFGSFDGAYGGELFRGVVPRVLDIEDYKKLTLEELANGIYQVDTAGWAEPWDVLKKRIVDGFEEIAKEVEAKGGGNVLVVSHSMTIGSFVCILNPEIVLDPRVENGSVTLVEYENGHFSIQTIGDESYRKLGANWLEAHSEEIDVKK